MFFAVGITGKTALESEHAITTLENQPAPGEKATGRPQQVPSTSAWGINSNAEDGRPEDTQTEVKIQNMKVGTKSLQNVFVTKLIELFSHH